MASTIFTYDPNPPRVSSPWLPPEDSERRDGVEAAASGNNDEKAYERNLEKLQPEPQEGPIEYKTHLLLRARRAYTYMSTTTKIAGSQQSRSTRPEKPIKQIQVPLASSSQSRQERLLHLTTQLLWRLQQSSPYHAKAKGDLIIPKIPEDHEDLNALQKPRRLLPGLEESNGALYELGVADDGTLVGLAKDEMDESMTTLKVMAASLGCKVEVQRMKVVGNCEWIQQPASEENGMRESRMNSDLWVAEALITPVLGPDTEADNHDGTHSSPANGSPAPDSRRSASKTEQLRVSLVGPTTSGKTTLLGTLIKGDLDDGRGSSRLNLLRHRHELVSGQTSSVAQELIGYKGNKIINQARGNLETWADIHDLSEDGRLVFFSDSAGHIRFRRTTLRGLVGWAPHWTLLCVPSTPDGRQSKGGHSLSGAADDLSDNLGATDLALAHLDLCLKLEVPLVIVMTKMDITNNPTMKEIIKEIFARIRAEGRAPELIMPDKPSKTALSEITLECQEKVNKVVELMSEDGNSLSRVPVVLTSAAKGDGLGVIHALLRSLPMPPTPTARDYTPQALNPEQPVALFHIDDTYEPRSLHIQDTLSHGPHGTASVVAGYLRFGTMSIGDKIVVGPFPAEENDRSDLMPRDHPSPGYGLSISHPSVARNMIRAAAMKGEWRNATIINIHNLRLRVRTMEAGQAGTIQIKFDESSTQSSPADTPLERPKPASVTIRKGQVLAIPSQHMLDTQLSLQAATGLKAVFKDRRITNLHVGMSVNIYVATVRAAAKIVHIARAESTSTTSGSVREDADDVFEMDDHMELNNPQLESEADAPSIERTISLELLNHREWIELGSTVVLMEGSRNESVSFYGFVGRVVEIEE